MGYEVSTREGASSPSQPFFVSILVLLKVCLLVDRIIVIFEVAANVESVKW